MTWFKTFFTIVLTFTAMYVYFILNPAQVEAQSCSGNYDINFVNNASPPSEIDVTANSYDFRIDGLNPQRSYSIRVSSTSSDETYALNSEGNGIFSASIPLTNDVPNAYGITIIGDLDNDGNDDFCNLWRFEVTESSRNSCQLTYSQNGYSNPACLSRNIPVTVTLSNVIFNNQVFTGELYITSTGQPGSSINVNNGHGNTTLSLPDNGTTRLQAYNLSGTGALLCESGPGITVKAYCTPEEQSAQITDQTELADFKICSLLTGTAYTKCIDCVGEEEDKIWTALGCIPTTPEAFTGFFITFAIGIGGGLALLLMIYGAFLIATSGGNPETSQKGKEVFGGAIMGLLFIIFSVVLLNIIGIEILHIPGL